MSSTREKKDGQKLYGRKKKKNNPSSSWTLATYNKKPNDKETNDKKTDDKKTNDKKMEEEEDKKYLRMRLTHKKKPDDKKTTDEDEKDAIIRRLSKQISQFKRKQSNTSKENQKDITINRLSQQLTQSEREKKDAQEELTKVKKKLRLSRSKPTLNVSIPVTIKTGNHNDDVEKKLKNVENRLKFAEREIKVYRRNTKVSGTHYVESISQGDIHTQINQARVINKLKNDLKKKEEIITRKRRGSSV